MRVATLLRKEKEGSLYKQSSSDKVYAQLEEKAKNLKGGLAIDKEKADWFGGGAYDYMGDKIYLSKKDPSTLAHELGHAELERTIPGMLLQSRLGRAAAASPIVPYLTGTLGASATAASGSAGVGALVGGALTAASHVPTLVMESWATSNGRRLLKELKADPRLQEEYEKSMASGMASYWRHASKQTAKGALTGGIVAKLASPRAAGQENDFLGYSWPKMERPARASRKAGDAPTLDLEQAYPDTESTQSVRATTATVPTGTATIT